MIPELWKSLTGTFSRWALTGLFGYLIAKNVVKAEDAAKLIEYGGGALAVLGWGFWAKKKDKILIYLGLGMQAGSTFDQLKAEAKDVSVLTGVKKTNVLIPLLLIGTLGLSACGGDAAKKTEEAIRKVYVGLQGASESVEILNKGGKLSDASALRAYEGLNTIGVATKQFKEAVRALGAITPENKGDLGKKIDLIVAQIDIARQNGLVGLSPEVVAKIELHYEMAKSGFLTLKGVIAAIKKPVPVRDVPALTASLPEPFGGPGLGVAYLCPAVYGCNDPSHCTPMKTGPVFTWSDVINSNRTSVITLTPAHP